MIIRLTSKLAKKIGSDPFDSDNLNIAPFIDWTGHLFTAQRIQYIIITNSASLYSIIMPGRGVSSEQMLAQKAMIAMEEYMCKDGFELVFRHLIVPYCKTIIFSKANNRKAIGSIVEMIRMAKFWLIERQYSLFDTMNEINDAPMGSLKYNHPKKVFRQLKTGISSA